MSITRDDYRRARHITEPAAQLLDTTLRAGSRGPASATHPRILLTGMVLAIDLSGDAHVSTIHGVLTRDLPREQQWDLGVLTRDADGSVRQLSEHDLYALTKKVTRKLSHTKARAWHLSDEDRLARRQTLDAVAHTRIAATLIDRPAGAVDYALDATAVWASERAPSDPATDTLPDPDHEEDGGDPALPAVAEPANLEPTGEEEPSTTEETDPPPAPTKPGRRGVKGPSDAAFGAKTAKSGRRISFYGYDVHALVRAPERAEEDPANPDKLIPRSEPPLLVDFVALPASTDVVDPCLGMIDRSARRGETIRNLLVDRHYSYKSYRRWLAELVRRGINQVADAHKSDQGFRIWDRMKVAASVPHCPRTPDHLGTIDSPGVAGTDEDWETFHTRIEERQAYAVQFVNRLDANGKMKCRCPARAGTLGCPRVDGTVATAVELGLPIVVDPPADDIAPAVCRNDTVTMRVRTDDEARAMKLAQKLYWGSRPWRRKYARRTFVEGWFGVLKSSTSTGLDRGSHAFVGLPLVTVVIAASSAVTNMRLLRSWHTETGLGDPTHPLLVPDEQFHGFAQLTREQADQIDAQHEAVVLRAAARAA